MTTMVETRYGLRMRVQRPYEWAIEQITQALKAEGFGVLTTIDVKETLKQKLDRDFRRYTILLSCNPVLAERALHADLDIGLLLPCNVIVYEDGADATVIAAMAPQAALGNVTDNDALTQVAGEADARLRRALLAVERS